MENYGKLFKELREERGLTLSRVAKDSKISKSTLSRFENGETQLAIDKFVSAVTAMSLEIDISENHQKVTDIVATPTQPKASEEKLSEAVVEPNLAENQLVELETLYNNKQMVEIFSFQNSLSYDTIENSLLKILAKTFISDLGLDMELPASDIEKVRHYIGTEKSQTRFYFKVLGYFDDLMTDDLLEMVLANFKQDQSIDVKPMIHFINQRLSTALNQNHLKEAATLSSLINRLTE